MDWRSRGSATILLPVRTWVATYRLAIGGHLDTVPVNNNATARIEDGVLHGLGSADMKGGLAVMLELARRVREPAIDVTYVFYAREEVAIEHNGLRELFREVPDLLQADVADPR